MDIHAIRQALNERPFVAGQRQVLLGRLSDQFPAERSPECADDSAPAGRDPSEGNSAASEEQPAYATAVRVYLDQLAAELARHQLSLVRGEPDTDELYARQSLRREGPLDWSWMSEALTWSARVTTLGLEMVVPGLVGLWLDRRFGTSFLAAGGFVLGLGLVLRDLAQWNRATGDRAGPK